MNSGLTTESGMKPPEKRSARWPGVVLSIFVPGFGLLRAGIMRRAAWWFLTIIGFQWLRLIVLAIPSAPTSLATMSTIILLGLTLAMYTDSYREGKMTRNKVLAFISCFLLILTSYYSCGYVVKIYTMPSISMEPTISKGDKFLVNRVIYRFHSLKRGDVVAFRTGGIGNLAPGDIYIKRVVAFAGETVKVIQGHLFINDQKMTGTDGIPSLIYTAGTPSAESVPDSYKPYQVPENDVFVLGDNSRESADSRIFGGIPKKSILGQAIRVLSPYSRIGRIR